MIRKSLFFFILPLFTCIFAFHQKTFAQHKIIAGIVKDNHSDEPVAFSSVQFKNKTIGKLTDSAGRFSFSFSKWPSDTLEITNVAYQAFIYVFNKTKDSIFITILMEPRKISENATVKIKINRGLYLWKRIVQHKPQNDKFRFDNFSFILYVNEPSGPAKPVYLYSNRQ